LCVRIRITSRNGSAARHRRHGVALHRRTLLLRQTHRAEADKMKSDRARVRGSQRERQRDTERATERGRMAPLRLGLLSERLLSAGDTRRNQMGQRERQRERQR
jgi:hypothetical protein